MKRAIVILAALFALAFPVFAQNPAQGSPMYGSFDGDGMAHVNLQNLNVTTIFPILGSRGRSLGIDFSLSYNSSIWSTGSAWTPVFNASGSAAWGWNKLHFFGWADFSITHAHCAGDPVGLNLGTITYSHFSFVGPDGTRHPFTISYHVPGEDCGIPPGGTYTGYATDGSGYYIDANQMFVRDRSGLTVTQFGNGLKDTNGNSYTSTSNYLNGQTTTTWTDSRGHTALQLASPNPTNTLNETYSYYDAAGNFQEVRLTYQSLNVATHFACSGVVEYSGSAVLLTDIRFLNGQDYAITYEATPGNSGKYTGRIQKITLPSGGYVQFTYGSTHDGVNCSDASATDLTITRYDGANSAVTHYVRAQVGGVWQTTVTYPQLPYDSAANQVVAAFDANGHETSRKIYQGSATGNPLRTINTTWISAPTSRTIVLEDGTTAAKTDLSYDSYGNLLSTSEHDWGTVSTPGPIVRSTTLTYLSSSAYSNLNILNRVSRKTVADGTGVVHSREDTGYDESALGPCPTGVVQHDDTNYSCSFLTRGNPTSVTSYKDAATPSGGITKTFQFDVFGNLVQAQMNCCQTKTWTYSVATQYAFPDSITRGSSSGMQLTTRATYNSSDGSVATSTDENGKTTSYAYDGMGRPTTVTRPDTTVITYTYDDVNNAVSVATPVQGTSVVQRKTTYDGLVRTTKTSVLDGSNNSYAIVERQFDLVGRPYKVSNPHNSTAQYWTEYRFDALGRPTVVIPPDGSATSNNTRYAYPGNTVTITDPSGKARKQQVDGLGRAVKTFEPDVANGNSLTQETDMTYSATDSLLQVTQGAQTRTYAYDDLGRLLTVKTPETSQAAVSYVYNDFSLVTQRTDPRNVVTNYTYDTLNRMTSVSYTIPQGSQVSSMPNVCNPSGGTASANVCFYYDEGGSAANALGRLTHVADVTGSETYTFDANLEEVTSAQKVISGTTYTTQYSYNLAQEVASVAYPSGRVVQESYDAIGRLCSVGASGSTCTTGTSYASGFAYSAAGEITTFNYGNGVTANMAYSPDRLQMTSLSYVKGSTPLASLNYWYKTDATNCANAPGTNNGQIQCITDGVDSGRNESFTYDALYRLTSAVTKGSTAYPQWGLSFTYDRYGNRTAQSIIAGCAAPMTCPSPSATVDPATNHITTAGYDYDLNGNMTSDGQNSLVFDGENRVTGSSGSLGSGTYIYDGGGLRVKKISGSTTTVYIFSGSKVIAEYDNGAAVGSPSREYVYAGPTLLAKFEAGGTTYYHPDHLSNRVLTDANGTSIGQRGHYPFGETWYETGTTTKLKFTTYDRDSESNNDYALARTYVNRIARFSSPDSVAGSTSMPQSLNGYSYVQNDPADSIDPSGMKMIPDYYGLFSYMNEFRLSEVGSTPAGGHWGGIGNDQWIRDKTAPLPPVIADLPSPPFVDLGLGTLDHPRPPLLSRPCDVSPKTLDDYLASKKSPMAGQGANLMNAGQQYDLDPRLLVSIAGAETSFGRNITAGQYNAFNVLYNGLNSPFASWQGAMNSAGHSLTNPKNGYDLYNTATMYSTYCSTGTTCDKGLENINTFMGQQNATIDQLRFPCD